MAASVSLRSRTPRTHSPRPQLPEGWSIPENVEDVVVVEGLSIRRAGVASVAPDGEEVTGSAAALERAASKRVRPAPDTPSPTSPASRAWFELLERVSIVEAMRSGRDRYELRTDDGELVRIEGRLAVFPESDEPSRWRHARSNGVAVHVDWQSACQRALWELAERDRVLASWYGHVRPERIDGAPVGLGRVTSSYDWSAWAFPQEDDGSFSRGIEVVGVFGFPTKADLPLALGFAARPRRQAALEDATREAIQLLGFLWGEPSPVASAETAPTAMGHLDFYQVRENHGLLRSWLAGEHLSYAAVDRRGQTPTERLGHDVLYVELTPAWLGGSLRVAKAVCPATRPLVFGESPFGEHLPKQRRIHPVS
jgi:hypothetical protein